MGEKAETVEIGMEKARCALKDGSALKKFRDMVEGQGGNPDITEDYSLMPQSEFCMKFEAWQDGYIESLDAMKIGLASQHTGAGRETKEDVIDLSAGVVLKVKIGDFVTKGNTICEIFGNNSKKVEKALEEMGNAVKISVEKPALPKLIKKVIK